MNPELQYTLDPKARFKLHTALTDEDFAAIGRITVSWSYLELEINMALWAFLDYPNFEDRAEHLKIPFKKRARLVKDLASALLKDKPTLPTLIDLMDRASHLRAQRDMIIHGNMSRSGMTNGKIFLKHTQHATEADWRDYQKSTEDLTKLAEDITAIHWDFDQLIWHEIGLGKPQLPQTGPNEPDS